MGTTERTGIEERVDRLESETAIKHLMDDYAFGCDRKDPDRFMKVFHDDAEYAIPGAFGTAVGREKIESTLRQIWEVSPETHHWITNIGVDFSGPDAATGDAQTICFVRTSSGGEGFVCAYYDNSYERRDGIWRATSISLEVPWWKKVEFGDLLAE